MFHALWHGLPSCIFICPRPLQQAYRTYFQTLLYLPQLFYKPQPAKFSVFWRIPLLLSISCTKSGKSFTIHQTIR